MPYCTHWFKEVPVMQWGMEELFSSSAALVHLKILPALVAGDEGAFPSTAVCAG